ncbi:heme o synthase [Cohnella zeiphila]|uniref:Protoheme IX farnesyltransferase n=1 Tax=Cohnella zeiphila TaxID=2761120 RepID=A0A7X0SKR7_9BACL|nr:heme o synthase [Cohnella zeiphila]MBB6730515.1 protoheme IX farnesyltransferase [Cohnella zeiphila]
MQSNTIGIGETSTSFTKVVFDTIKIGIIKSNLIAMFAGLSMALYVHHIPFFEKIGNIVLALIGSSLVIGAAGVFNNLYDRDIDGIMERTKKRPTVSGIVGLTSGLIVGFWIAIVGLIALYLASPLAAVFGFLGLFIYVVPYTMWTKRRTVYNTEVGSLSGAMPPLIGWAAISSDMLHPGIIALFVLMLIWQMPHFYAIAIRRMEEYRAAGIPMLPVVKGMRRTYVQMNVYLAALFLSSILFWLWNPYIAVTNALISLGWLILSVVGYRRMEESGWARTMFIFSLNHMTVLMLLIIGYSFIAPLF